MFTLKQIALEVQGAIVGDSSTIITSVDDIEEANEGSISFAFLPKYIKIVKSSNASAFIVTNKEDLKDCSGIVVENPYLAMIKILELFSKKIPIKNKLDTNA
ncbi:UDP-3-O-(3-hydroxymyristoyl)glucosamine N-acyltransferase, partial [Candidatus Marinimicrobia bacterium]|nr:UDP-3-O-(3-hydroxymyristoyl)glucosamine N-acyltransferase [Candidatus Neomarinimicrobiota bacterium]